VENPYRATAVGGPRTDAQREDAVTVIARDLGQPSPGSCLAHGAKNPELESGTVQTRIPGVDYLVFIMGSWKKPDPELLPIHRPRCPKCQQRMITSAVLEGPEGLEDRTFKSLKCAHTDKLVLISDPLKSSVTGWLRSELRPPK
jgi:hypothetical protein